MGCTLSGPAIREKQEKDAPLEGIRADLLSRTGCLKAEGALFLGAWQKFQAINGLIIPGGGTDLVPGPFFTAVERLLKVSQNGKSLFESHLWNRTKALKGKQDSGTVGLIL